MKTRLPRFRPPFLLRGPTFQTLAGGLLPVLTRGRTVPVERLMVEVEPGERILLLRSKASGTPVGRLLLLHGLGGCADSRWLRRMLEMAYAGGWEVVRMNARGAGEGIHLSTHLPHAGCTMDLAGVLASSPWSPAAASSPLVAVGFSLGGAVLLRYMGEAGMRTGLDGAVAINPPTDLALCLQQLERPSRRPYQLYFVAALRRDQKLRARLYPELHRPPLFRRHRSVRALDEAFVAPDAGYTSADTYYAGCSAASVLAGIRTPTLILSSGDDPFVPAAMLRRDVLPPGAAELVLVPRGGHLGYLHRVEGRWCFWATAAALAAARKLAGLDQPETADLVTSTLSVEEGAS
ncbi:MAG: YheT family hydrolase [Acidobacteriota bacterium]